MTTAATTRRTRRAHAPSSSAYPEFLDTSQAAARAGVHRQTAMRWAEAGVVRAIKVVGRWRIDAADLERLLHGEPPPHPVAGLPSA